MPVSTKPNVGKQPIEIFNRGTDVHLGSPITKIKKEVDKISVFPKPERMFPEGQRPKGGEYLNPKTGDVLTNKNVESASISITPEGKPKFDASPTNSPSEPRLRPTVKGFVDLGKEIGKISVRGKEHPVYDKIVNRYAGGSVVERNPYANYKSKAI